MFSKWDVQNIEHGWTWHGTHSAWAKSRTWCAGGTVVVPVTRRLDQKETPSKDEQFAIEHGLAIVDLPMKTYWILWWFHVISHCKKLVVYQRVPSNSTDIRPGSSAVGAGHLPERFRDWGIVYCNSRIVSNQKWLNIMIGLEIIFEMSFSFERIYYGSMPLMIMSSDSGFCCYASLSFLRIFITIIILTNISKRWLSTFTSETDSTPFLWVANVAACWMFHSPFVVQPRDGNELLFLLFGLKQCSNSSEMKEGELQKPL